MKTTLTIFLLASLVFSVFEAKSVTPVMATATWIVPKDFVTIQEAIDASNPGDTIIVNEGIYAEGQINVNKPLTLLANGTAIIDGLQKGHVLIVSANNVTIEGFTVMNSSRGWGLSGILLQKVQNCKVSGNIVINNTNGIGIKGLGYNIVRDNLAMENRYGIGLYGAHSHVVEGNILRSNLHGIRLYGSDQNVIQGNVAIENGVLLGELGIGIYLEGSSRNSIEENICINNRWTGILVWTFSDGNIVGKNNISNSHNGIYLSSSMNNSIYGNTIDSTSWAGIKLRSESISNTISGNKITYTHGAPGAGILLDWAINNTIVGNEVSNNRWGISIEPGLHGMLPSYDNIIYHNNFINNTWFPGQPPGSGGQVHNFDPLTSINIWDNGYPYGGNYWSDYKGVDFYFGPYQNETGNDGIGDTQYPIDTNNRDKYPLMNPWKSFTTANITITPNTININMQQDKWVTAYIELPKGYGPANIDITTVEINGTVPAVTDSKYGFVTNSSGYLVDLDGDGVLERVVKFESTEIISYILNSLGYPDSKSIQISLTITGKLYLDTTFECSFFIRIIKKGKA